MADVTLTSRSAVSAANLPAAQIPVQESGGSVWEKTTGQDIANLPPNNDIVTVSGSRSLANSDNGKTLVVTGTNVTLTVPSGLVLGFGCMIEQQGTTQVTIAWSTPVVVRNADAHTKTALRYAVIALIYVGVNLYNLSGRTGA